MRVNQEDRPDVSDLPFLEVKNKIKKLVKQTLKDVIIVIPLIKNSTYTLIQINPYNPSVNLSIEQKDQLLFRLFSLFIPQYLLNLIAKKTNFKVKRNYEGGSEPKPHARP